MQIKQAVGQFLYWLEVDRECSPMTIEAYSSDLKQFSAFLRQEGVEAETGAVAPEILRSFMGSMKGRGLSQQTVARRLNCLRSLWRFLNTAGLDTSNPCIAVSVPRKRRCLPTFLSAEECRALLQATEHSHCDDRELRTLAEHCCLCPSLSRQGQRKYQV